MTMYKELESYLEAFHRPASTAEMPGLSKPLCDKKDLMVEFTKTFLVHDYNTVAIKPWVSVEKTEPREESMSDGPASASSSEVSMDHRWTVGRDSMVSHTRILGTGGFGEVHEVGPVRKVSLI